MTKNFSDPYYFDCPCCGLTENAKVSKVGQDLMGRGVYRCNTCNRMVTAYHLELESRSRRSTEWQSQQRARRAAHAVPVIVADDTLAVNDDVLRDVDLVADRNRSATA
jgi:transposase-like protein